MAETPPTRLSLLVRLRRSDDTDAWSQFAELYSPLVFNFGRRCGLQECDAADLVQDVMGEVAKSIKRFQYDPQIGKFRSWLYKIARRSISRMVQLRARQPTATGDSDALRLFANQPDSHNEIKEFWDREYQRNLIDWAAENVRPHFNERTWNAFWLTSVEEQPAQKVAETLGMSVGSVYVAKSRVTKRIAEKIREIDDSQ